MGFTEAAVITGGLGAACFGGVSKALRSPGTGLAAATPHAVLGGGLVGDGTLAMLRVITGTFQIWLTVDKIALASMGDVCNKGGGCIEMRGWNMFSTFTVWNWSLMGCYFFITGTLALLPAKTQQKLPRSVLFSLWVSFQVLFSTALLVSIVVWGVILPAIQRMEASGDFSEKAVATAKEQFWGTFGICAHTLNVVFMVLDGLLNRMQLVRSHVPFAVLFGCIYVVFCWEFYRRNNFWHYDFLDYRSDNAAIPYTLLPLVLLLSFLGAHKFLTVLKPDDEKAKSS